MDDKTTSSLQPSTTFDDSSSSTTHSQLLPLNSCTPTYHSTTINPIPLSPIRPHIMEQKHQFNIASLMSPPEAAPIDNFTRATAASSMEPKSKESYPANRLPLSPPVSPETKTHTLAEDLSTITVRDPILFDSRSSPSSQPPLFPSDHETRRLVEEHIAARKVESFREASPPRSSDYQLALEFKSQVAQQYNANRRLWRLREMAQLREDSALRMGPRKYTTIAPAHAGNRPKHSPKSTSKVSGVKIIKTPRPTKPKVVREGTPDRGRIAREDKDFNSLADFCPPISSLPNRPNSLKVDWRGAPIDLRADPNAHLLHPDEVALAANLRLDCATYLTSKRRIFMRRVETLRINKEFRKTDAQQACKIDVNKASKLWTAFDKVGWLNPKWVQQYV